MRGRFAFWWRALTRGAGQINSAASWVGLIVLILGTAAGIAVPLVFQVSPLLTAVILLALLTVAVLEGGYRVWQVTDKEREAAQAEIERRFDALRYALRRGALDYNVALRPDGACNVQVGLRMANESDDHLRYEMKHIAIVIEGREVEDPQFYNRGTIVAAHGTDKFWYPFVEGVPVGWQTGSVEFTVRWGYPSGRFRYQRSQKLALRTSRLFGVAPPHDIHIDADLVEDSDVEDI